MITPREDQLHSASHLVSVMKSHGAALDGSDTGVGKTVTAIETIRQWDEPTLVVCPKAVVPAWHRNAGEMSVELDALNYEKLRTGNTPYGEWKVLRDGQEHFIWNRAVRRLVFDEVQRCQGRDSLNAELLRSARLQRIPTLMLSATVAEDPLDMDALGYVLRLHDGKDKSSLNTPDPYPFTRWARAHNCDTRNGGYFSGTEAEKIAMMARINGELFPGHGVRTRRQEVPGFPDSQITAELYEMGDPARIEALYAEMAEARAKLQARIDAGHYEGDPFVQCLRERQEIELLKVPVFVELAQEAISAGMSVAIFVNFRQTLEEIGKRLNTSCFVDGSQTGDAGALRREANRLAFQNDLSRVIICIGGAGGVGLDLHDVTGKHPRLALISAGYNAKELRQIFGRVWRAGALSKSLQRVIFAAGTREELVHRAVYPKLDRLDALNDGDLDPENLRICVRF